MSTVVMARVACAYSGVFLFATRPFIMGQVLGIVYRVISMHLIKKAGYLNKSVRSGAVTPIQRFGSALNLNIDVQWWQLTYFLRQVKQVNRHLYCTQRG
jgi:hypothetical protein